MTERMAWRVLSGGKLGVAIPALPSLVQLVRQVSVLL